MKGIAVESARVSASLGVESLTAGILNRLNIAYDPPSGPVSYPGNRLAASCISVDFDVTEASRAKANHEGTLALLELSEGYSVPITWAICGMTADDDGEAYRRILDSPVHQEIGIHTYSHIDALKCEAAEFEEDIRHCLASLGLDAVPRTFVFPWNRENHFEVVRALGFRSYRGKERAMGAPRLSQGLWNVRPVYYVDQKSLGAEALMKKYLSLSVGTGSVFHLWTHPWGLGIDGDVSQMKKTLEPVFARMAELDRRGKLALSTMGQLAEHFDSTGAPERGNSTSPPSTSAPPRQAG